MPDNIGKKIGGLTYSLLQAMVRKRRAEKIFGNSCMIIRSVDPEKEFRLDDPVFLESIADRRFVLADGYYFVDYLNLLKHASRVKQHFIPLERHVTNIDRSIEKARQSCDILVGVHIRQGDYRNYMGGRFFFDTSSFATIMEKVAALFENQKVGFLVCSDEPPDSADFPALEVTAGPGHIIEDMYSLARCDYIIGPPSTYSRWACFYGDVPTYHISNPDRDPSLADFILYEDMVRQHIETAPQYPSLSKRA